MNGSFLFLLAMELPLALSGEKSICSMDYFFFLQGCERWCYAFFYQQEGRF